MTTKLNSCLTQNPKMAVRATSTRRQPPAPIRRVADFHSAENIELKLRYDEQSMAELEVSLRQTLKGDTVSNIPFLSRTSQLGKYIPIGHRIEAIIDRKAQI